MSFPDTVQSARLQLSPGYPLGVTEAMIESLVHAFYAKVRQDPELGPIFGAVITDWGPHLQKMCNFWSSVTLMSGRYHGTPMPAHARLVGVGPDHFGRWLQLFEETAGEVCPPEAAALFIDRARRIAQSLQMGMAVARGELPPMFERVASFQTPS
jgi:hemoglobin